MPLYKYSQCPCHEVPALASALCGNLPIHSEIRFDPSSYKPPKNALVQSAPPFPHYLKGVSPAPVPLVSAPPSDSSEGFSVPAPSHSCKGSSFTPTLDTLTSRDKALLMAGFYNIMYINEYIDSIIVECSALLKKHKIFRFEVKRWYNLFRKEKDGYLRNLCRTMANDYDDFCEQADTFYELLKPDFQVLYYSVRREFLNAFPEDKVDLYTYMYIIGHLFTFARENYYDWRCYYQRELPVIFAYSGFYSLDVTPWINRWNQLIFYVMQAVRFKCADVETSQMDTALKIFCARASRLETTIAAMKSTDDGSDDMKLMSLDLPERPPHIPIPERYTNWSRLEHKFDAEQRRMKDVSESSQP